MTTLYLHTDRGIFISVAQFEHIYEFAKYLLAKMKVVRLVALSDVILLTLAWQMVQWQIDK